MCTITFTQACLSLVLFFSVYVVIRLFIRLVEYLIARPKHRALRRRMMQAPDYVTWRSYARELDISQKRHHWLDAEDEGSMVYNWRLVQELRSTMRQARETGDSLLALATLQQCTRKVCCPIVNRVTGWTDD